MKNEKFPSRKTKASFEQDDDKLEFEADVVEPFPYAKQCKSKPSPAKNQYLCCFFANISSLSIKRQEYLQHNRGRYHIFGLLETHNATMQDHFWNLMGCKHATNLAQQTSTFGSHGGEALAFKKHLNITKVRQDILDIIQATSSIPLRFSAVIVTTQEKQYSLAITYWYSNQLLSENNKELLGHLAMLRHLLNLPLLTFGDYNIPHTLLEDSGWLKPHRLNIRLLNGGPSTNRLPPLCRRSRKRHSKHHPT